MEKTGIDRRNFVKGAFGLTVLAAGACAGAVSVRSMFEGASAGTQAPFFVTQQANDVSAAVGPVMQAGIGLVDVGGVVAGVFEGTKLFTVDGAGAQLVQLADGTRTLDAIASEAGAALGGAVRPIDVAGFFIELSEAGFLQNKVLVNLFEIQA